MKKWHFYELFRFRNDTYLRFIKNEGQNYWAKENEWNQLRIRVVTRTDISGGGEVGSSFNALCVFPSDKKIYDSFVNKWHHDVYRISSTAIHPVIVNTRCTPSAVSYLFTQANVVGVQFITENSQWPLATRVVSASLSNEDTAATIFRIHRKLRKKSQRFLYVVYRNKQRRTGREREKQR